MVKRFEVLDSFRGLAALFVVLFHMHYVGSITELSFFRGTSLFVEFFFVLSGFVLAHGYGWKENLKFKDFLIARTFRLLPLHIVILVVFILLEFGKLFAYQHGFHFNDIPFTNETNPNDIIPNLLLLQSWLPNTNSLSWNTPSWSISIEYYMYMLFFASLLIKKENLKYILWFLISIIMSVFIFLGVEIAQEILRGLSCFFGGALTYLLYKNTEGKINFNKNYFTLLEIILLILVVLILSSDIHYKSLVASLLFCIQVFIFAFEKGSISQILKQKIFLYLGKLSYSIYMIHSVILFFALSTFMIIQKIFNIKLEIMVNDVRTIDLGNPIFNNISIIITLAIIIFLSGFTYKYIEQKGQNMGKSLKKKLSNR